jgi:hypothetical protein
MMITTPRNLTRGLVFLGFVCFVMPISGQTSAVNREKELQQKRELQQRVFVLVDEIATTAHGLKLPENRSFVLTSAADLLWRHDEKRARTLFWDALNSINLITRPGADKETTKQSSEKEDLYHTIFRLRRDLLLTVARRDPQLALEMLRSTRQLAPEQVKAGYRLPDDHDIEHQIMTEAAARDPQRGLQIARESLSKGSTFQALDMLHRLNQQDPIVASKFANDIIDKLGKKNLAEDIVASQTAINLLRWSRRPTEAQLQQDAAAWSYSIKLNNEKRRQLIEMITNAALTFSANSSLLNSVNEIMPEIQAIIPKRTVLLQKKLNVFEQTLNSEQRESHTYFSLMQGGSPEEMISGSLKVEGDRREMLRGQGIRRAIYQRRADTLREFIKNEIEDDSLQRSLLDNLDTQQITAATVRGDADELRKLLPGIRRTEERARAMAEIAVALEKNGDHAEAVKLLDEARTMIKVDFESETQSNALLALVAAYAVVDPSKAFAIIERTIDRANDQIGKALLLDKIARTGVVKNGELLMQNSTIISPEYMLFRYGKAVTVLANADFNRTRAAADRFERMELRLMMRLLLAQSLLEDGGRTK